MEPTGSNVFSLLCSQVWRRKHNLKNALSIVVPLYVHRPCKATDRWSSGFWGPGTGVIYENMHEYALFRITRLETVKNKLMFVPATLRGPLYFVLIDRMNFAYPGIFWKFYVSNVSTPSHRFLPYVFNLQSLNTFNMFKCAFFTLNLEFAPETHVNHPADVYIGT